MSHACSRECNHSEEEPVSVEQENRIKAALDMATWGQVDGAHHKTWAVDQMVRALTGCPMVTKTAIDVYGRTYTYETLGESDEYLAWVRAYEDNDVDPEDRDHWDTGIIP